MGTVKLPDLAALAVIQAEGVRLADLQPDRIVECEPADYPIVAAARSRTVFLLPRGPRVVREIAIEPRRGTEEAWRAARLRLTWESDLPKVPGVDLLARDLLGSRGAGPALMGPRDDAAWVCRFPMPYQTDAVLEIVTDRPISGRIRVASTHTALRDAGYFRTICVGKDSATSRTVARETGRGHVVALASRGAVSPIQEPFSLARSCHLALDDRDRGSFAALLATGQNPADSAFMVGPGAVFGWLRRAPLAYDRGMVVALRATHGQPSASIANTQPDSANSGGAKPGQGDVGESNDPMAIVYFYSDARAPASVESAPRAR